VPVSSLSDQKTSFYLLSFTVCHCRLPSVFCSLDNADRWSSLESVFYVESFSMSGN